MAREHYGPMLKRTNIAAGGTMLALGALAAVAVGATGGTSTASAPPQKAPAPIIRTVVVHRTVKIVKHEKPKTKPIVNSSPVAAPPPAAAAPRPAPVYHAPVIQVAQVQPVRAITKAKVQTRTSGAGGTGGTHKDSEHEGGSDD